MRFDELARRRELDVSDHENRRVIRMIEGVVEFAQAFRRDAFDVGTPADRRVMVWMFAKRRRNQGRVEDAHRAVVVALELVAHDRHLRTPLDIGDQGAPHTIRFEFDGKR